MMRGEPVTVPEIPHPRHFSLRFTASDEWFACGMPPDTRQGWKLYVSLTVLNAHDMIERLVPVVSWAGLHFKYIKSIKLLGKLSAGIFGYPQIGKCFVIYLPVPSRKFIRALRKVVEPFQDQCPAVPCAIPFGGDLPLYYRYGAYRDNQLELDGARRADNRDDAGVAVPAGVEDLLARYTKPIRESRAVRLFLRRYPVYQALIQQGKCGIFLGMNLKSKTFQEVVLKVGYHRGQVQPDGTDGCSLLRRELAFYRELDARNLKSLAPRLVDALDVPRKVILVLEYLSGKNLLLRKLQGQLTVEHVERCWAIMDSLHACGAYLGDAKLANFMMTNDGDLRVLDFEAAGIFGDESPAFRTFFVNPEPANPYLADRAHFLASVLDSYEEGHFRWEDRCIDLGAWIRTKPKSAVCAWAVGKLREVLTSCAITLSTARHGNTNG